MAQFRNSDVSAFLCKEKIDENLSQHTSKCKKQSIETLWKEIKPVMGKHEFEYRGKTSKKAVFGLFGQWKVLLKGSTDDSIEFSSVSVKLSFGTSMEEIKPVAMAKYDLEHAISNSIFWYLQTIRTLRQGTKT